MKTKKYLIPQGTKVYNIYFNEPTVRDSLRYFNKQRIGTSHDIKFESVESTEYDIEVNEFTVSDKNWEEYHYLWAYVKNNKNEIVYYILIEKNAVIPLGTI